MGIVLITGAEGFIGKHLTSYLKTKAVKVIPTSEHQIKGFVQMDILNREQVEDVISLTKPDYIFHLAAQSRPELSITQPQHTVAVNCEGTINLLEACTKLKNKPIILITCSSAQYGRSKHEEILNPQTRIQRPLTVYGATKSFQEMLAKIYLVHHGLDVKTIRLFNTTGPGKKGDFLGDWTYRAAKEGIIKYGNTNTSRSLLDVRDVTRALWNAIHYCKPATPYDLCSDHIHQLKYVLDQTQQITRKKTRKDKNKIRKNEEKEIMGNNKTFKEKTGWKPTIPLKQTIKDSYEYWRQKNDN